MVASMDSLEVVNDQIILALDVVGKGFEAKTMFLPQLLMSAEARLADLLQYLDSTDWYAARLAETGAAIPDNVREKRAAARVEIDGLRARLATTQEPKQQGVQPE